MIKKINSLLLITILIFIFSCNKENDITLENSSQNKLEHRAAPTINQELADFYFVFFGFHEGREPVYIFDQGLMINALQQINIPINNSACLGCPTLDCSLHEVLYNDPAISLEIKEEINQNYIARLYDLSVDFPVEEIESNLLLDLVELSCNPYNIINPCTGNFLPFDIIRDVLINPSDPLNPNITLSTFYDELNNEDYIIEDATFSNCSYGQCIFNKIIQTNTPTNCALIEPLFDSNNFGVILHKIDSGVDRTEYNDETNVANVFINMSCTGSNERDLSLASTIIHELIHAEIMMTLFNLGLDPNNIDSFDEAWDNYQMDYMLNLQDQYNLNDMHHAVMVFVEGDDSVPGGGAVGRIAEILWELNGMQLTIEHYYHLAWGGLRYIDSQWAEDEYGTSSSYFILHQELITDNPNLSIGC